MQSMTAISPGVPPEIRASTIEKRSIDHVPSSERHGRVSSLGAIWFVGNINLTAMATGVAALSIGTSLMWTVIATVLGCLFGTFFMAFHSAQGPHLGVPQLVQSRPQFGYIGAAVTVFVAALVNYIAYNTSDAILSGSAMHTMFDIPSSAGYLVAAAVAAILAIFGYNWIHRVNRWLTWPLVVIMLVLTAAAVSNATLPAGVWHLGPFQPAPFMTVFVIMAGFQLGWAPYVSDYSRYLPAKTSTRSTFWWTYLPSVLSGIWVFVLGAVVAAAAPGTDPVTALHKATADLGMGFGWVGIAALLVGLLSVMGINQYGGSLTMISIADSFRPVRPTRRIRVVTVLAMFAVVWAVSQVVGEDNFNSFYANVLIFLAYVFTPWTAINLVDYFFVRRGRYSISEIFNPHGTYGRWGRRGTTTYAVSLLAMVPFMVTVPFTGFIAQHLGGVDYSMFVGLAVAAPLYWLSCRGLDVDAEVASPETEADVIPIHA